MQRNRFLGDLLSQLFDRRSVVRGKDDKRDIYELCTALLSAEGEVSGLQLASTILARYAAFDVTEKAAFFQFLNTDLDIDANAVAVLAHQYAATPTPRVFSDLCIASEPKRQEFLRRLNQPVGATADLVAMPSIFWQPSKTTRSLPARIRILCIFCTVGLTGGCFCIRSSGHTAQTPSQASLAHGPYWACSGHYGGQHKSRVAD